MSLKNQTLPLLKPPYVVYFITICALQFGSFCVAGGINLFLPDILNKLWNAEEEYGREFRVCEVNESDHKSMDFINVTMHRGSFKVKVRIDFFG